MNISSIIIKAQTKCWKTLIDTINKIKNVEVVLHEKNKKIIIAVIEAPNTQEELKALKTIQNTSGVINADMHLAYSENDLDHCSINSKKIAELIDNTPIESMKYYGDINHFIK